ncbi:hypothetical protein [Streptomyces sp. AN091965]|uniref:hypothetical protein n=1 Tax=Streptomyces sp. AN091965 TaxID=2927803 RepID=UPI001F61F763|nr:hypothetical protein [Streptomyces sp. AN091965]MCI3927861.1 hypothetical protein [Streptomyces sp. AN091965]
MRVAKTKTTTAKNAAWRFYSDRPYLCFAARVAAWKAFIGGLPVRSHSLHVGANNDLKRACVSRARRNEEGRWAPDSQLTDTTYSRADALANMQQEDVFEAVPLYGSGPRRTVLRHRAQTPPRSRQRIAHREGWAAAAATSSVAGRWVSDSSRITGRESRDHSQHEAVRCCAARCGVELDVRGIGQLPLVLPCGFVIYPAGSSVARLPDTGRLPAEDLTWRATARQQ